MTNVEQVMCDYDGLVRYIAAQYFAPGLTHDDLAQEGRIGLWKAIRDYRPDAGASFRTFAAMCITRQVITAVKAATRGKHGPLNNAMAIDTPLNGDPDGPTLAEILPAPEQRGAEDDERRDQLHIIMELLNTQLSPLEDFALAGVIGGETYGTLAVQAGVTAKTIDNALLRARGKARAIAQDFGLELQAAA